MDIFCAVVAVCLDQTLRENKVKFGAYIETKFEALSTLESYWICDFDLGRNRRTLLEERL